MIIQPADLAWDESGAPFNTRYGDIYSSRDAAAEVVRAFIEPAAIPDKLSHGTHLTVAELGFGTGLNFVVLAELARRSGTRLHFLSAELHPMRSADLERLRDRCPEQSRHLMDELVRQWPPLLHGWHRREFAGGRIVLSLWFGDVDDFLTRLDEDQAHGVDAWFLDGFAPDRNPAMWSEPVLERIARTSRTGATVSTFTSVGRVRRGLEAAGFEMRRVDQRPVKRESLAGVLRIPGRDLRRPDVLQVIGGGIAGCSLAAHLARRGIAVRLLEPRGQLATGASQMSAAQHSRLLADGSPVADWRAASHLYSTTFTRALEGVTATGAIQLPGPNADLERLERTLACYRESGDWLRWADAGQVADLAGDVWRPATGGLWFPDAAVVDLSRLCAELARTPGITVDCSDTPEPGTPVIWCNAHGIRDLPDAAGIPLHTLWGQADIIELMTPPRIALLGDGYILPQDRQCVVGSTYEYSPWDPDRASEKNLLRLAGQHYRRIGYQRAARLTTSDRMPLVGRFGDGWMSAAHGSMGATSAHLAAAVVQSLVMGWAPPVSRAVREAIAPDRFARRIARKLGRRSGSQAETGPAPISSRSPAR